MLPKTILLGTGNAGKCKEMQAVLGKAFPHIHFLSLADMPGSKPHIEENGDSFAENARIKAMGYAQHYDLPCLADDSGLCVDALEGKPGIYSARFAGKQASDQDNNKKLLEELAGEKERGAYFSCALHLYYGGKNIRAQGRLIGEILDKEQGSAGFGYDPLFFLPSLGKSLGEIDREQKNTLSHRAKALQSLCEKMMATQRAFTTTKE